MIWFHCTFVTVLAMNATVLIEYINSFYTVNVQVM